MAMASITRFFLSVFGLWTLLAQGYAGYLQGDCELVESDGTPIPVSDWQYDHFLHPYIADTLPPGAEVGRFTARNILEITNRQSRYIIPALVNGFFTLRLNEDFAHFEEWETEPDITVVVAFKCRDGTGSITIRGLVQDSNNHEPQFVGTLPYQYTLPFPFPPRVPLSCVTAVVVAATDFDLTTTRLDFEFLDADKLAIGGIWKVGRIYYANITTTQYITAALTATLRVTDTGIPALSTDTTVRIVADTKHSLKEYRTGENRERMSSTDL